MILRPAYATTCRDWRCSTSRHDSIQPAYATHRWTKPSRSASHPNLYVRLALVVEALEKGGFLARAEDHAMALGKCYRCKTVVEPYLSPQWFVKILPLAEPAIKAIEAGQIRLIPEQWTNNYLGWMRDIKDWCI